MSDGYRMVGIVGTGTIASGLAACASAVADVRMLARSQDSAERGLSQAERASGRVEGGDVTRVATTLEPAELEGCEVVVEAIVEDLDSKERLLGVLSEACPGADLATTTSSLSVAELGRRCGAADRFYALHVLNPVPQMQLVELCFPEQADGRVRERARAFCEAMGKTPIEVPDESGFVVNRLLFPYLFDAVRLIERSGMTAADVDTCMTLGAGHPMGPLRLLDFVGLDIAAAIGEELHRESGNPDHLAPEALRGLVDEGHLGRKSGRGFHSYD